VLPAIEAERMARTIATLTETLHRLQPMRCGTPENKTDGDPLDDDMPDDIDEFRINLARRIEAFVASRTWQDGTGEAKDCSAVRPRESGDPGQLVQEERTGFPLEPAPASAGAGMTAKARV